MATLTIRNLPDWVRDRLRVAAAKRGRSMEAEVRALISEVYGYADVGAGVDDEAVALAVRRASRSFGK